MGKRGVVGHLAGSKVSLLANGGYRWQAGGIQWEYEATAPLLLEMVAGKVRSGVGVMGSISMAQSYVAGWCNGYLAGQRVEPKEVTPAPPSQAVPSVASESEG